MNDDLRRLISLYVDNNRYADYDYVKEVVSIFIKKYGSNGLRDVLIIDENQKGVSNFEDYTIGINLDYIKKELIQDSWYDDIKSNLYLFNISVILVLKHEFNHFRQISRYRRVIDSDDFLDKLFVNSFIMACFSSMDFVNLYNGTDYCGNDMVLDEIYKDYHDCFVVERLAQMDAYRTIIEIIAMMKDELKRVYYYYLYEYYLYKIKDYCLMDDVVLAPVDKILFLMDDYFKYQDNHLLGYDCETPSDEFYDSIIDDYNVSDRFRYGLPISVKEYNDAVDFVRVMYILAGSLGNDVKKKKRKIEY